MFNESLNFRAAIKSFDSSKKVSDELINQLQESVIYAPTSSGLQPFQVINVKNLEIRAKLREVSHQAQFAESSHLFIFAAIRDISNEFMDRYMTNLISARAPTKEQESFIRNKLYDFANTTHTLGSFAWASKQAYIALGFMLLTAANLKIDACPMEGFDNLKVEKILGLDGYQPIVAVAVGYRAENDTYSKQTKVRLTKEQLFVEV